MAPKGNVTTRLNPLRLNTINHLRVRRPNQHEQNACVTVMSSMLSMCSPISGDQAGRVITISRGRRATTATATPVFFVKDPLLTLSCCEQTAGPPKATATRVVPPLRRNCASAWTHRYVFISPSYPSIRGHAADVSVSVTEIAREEEEHCQLPPDENVPQGCGTAQEGRCFGLNFAFGVHWHGVSVPFKRNLHMGVLGSHTHLPKASFGVCGCVCVNEC
jgi:hypothetical protein